MTHSAPQSPSPVKSQRSWLAWASLLIVSVLACAAVTASVVLRAHADQRHEVMEKLGKLETLSTAQSSKVWQALTLLLSEEKMSFVRLRGKEQVARGEIYALVEELKELEPQGDELNLRLGFEPDTERLAAVENAVHGFLSGVQGAFGQMTLSVDRIRQRLNFWDMNYGTLEESLALLKERDAEIAEASANMANKVTAIAALVTLLASALLVLRLSQVRARRQRELQAERLATLAASEARLAALVEHSSDLILVLEPDGQLRYATPSARVLGEAVRAGAASNEELESAAVQASGALSAIEAAIQAGAWGEAEASVDQALCGIDQVMGVDAAELVAAGNTELAIHSADGERHVFDVHASDLTEHENVGGIILNARNITERKQLEEQLRHQAMHDPLTNLPNRREFKRRYDETGRDERSSVSVIFVDLDGFKLVNDSFGHKSGDELLISTACRIGSCLADGDLLARQGGDEFLALVHGDAKDVANRIQAALAPPFVVQEKEVFVSASMGVVVECGEFDSDQAVQRADIAMYKAKQAGKAQAITFAEDMMGDAPERIALETDFRRALERDEFTVVYQPKVGLQSGVTESLEALVRWIHPTRGFVGPDLFIPFAEESGLVTELGRIVLEKACMDAVRWTEHGVVVAVNLSPVQFRNPNLVSEVRRAIEMSGIDPAYLELEITESAVLGDVTKTVEVLAEMKKLGVRLAIDDFGTGYSNLSHLRNFNVDVLKIDQCFVRGGGLPEHMEHLSDGAIVEAVIGMAKAFDLHVVAEGVESESHASELRSLGADLGQGYYFSKPVSGEGIDEFLAAERGRQTT